MAKAPSAGLFASTAVITTTESAQGTLTFDKLETGTSVYDKIGWIIHRVEWMISVSVLNLLLDQSDSIAWAIAMSNQGTTIPDNDPAVIVRRRLGCADFGTPANTLEEYWPKTDDFSNLPGGGILVLPNPLYLGVISASIASAASVTARIFFSAIEMNDQDYFNLIQSRQLLISS